MDDDVDDDADAGANEEDENKGNDCPGGSGETDNDTDEDAGTADGSSPGAIEDGHEDERADKELEAGVPISAGNGLLEGYAIDSDESEVHDEASGVPAGARLLPAAGWFGQIDAEEASKGVLLWDDDGHEEASFEG
jgi:hypothetical protein